MTVVDPDIASPVRNPAAGRSASPVRRVTLRAWTRGLGLALGLSVGVALLLTAVLPGSGHPLLDLAVHWVYAICIGGAIQLLADGGRHWVRRGLDRWIGAAPGDRLGDLDWRWYGPWLVVSAAVGYGAGGLMADTLLGRRHIATLLAGEGQAATFLLALTLMVSVLTSLVFIAQSRAEAANAHREQAERQAAEHRLRLLESQLEPHMLFNTLANLRALIGHDPAQAQAMLDRLNAYLRGTLGGSRALTHPLELEFERLDDYLALMAVRLGDRLQVAFDLPSALRGHPVPPLLLQPLVENAIRHGIEPSIPGGRVSVRAEVDGEVLRLSVVDTGVGLGQAAAKRAEGASHAAEPHRTGGFGTEQVRQRLFALHGTSARLVIGPGPQGLGTVARIDLPWRPIATPPVANTAAVRASSAPFPGPARR